MPNEKHSDTDIGYAKKTSQNEIELGLIYVFKKWNHKKT